MPDPLGGFSYTWPFYAAALAGYLLGSIPFGLIVTRLAGLGDVREIGSGNIGATNVLRTGHKPLAALTLFLDGGKGAAAVLIGSHYLTQDYAVLAGGGALLGHLFPVWLVFGTRRQVAIGVGVLILLAVATVLIVAGKGMTNVIGLLVVAVCALFAWGGKGVATFLGVMLGIAWPVGLIACATWLLVALLFRYSSLAALAAAAATPGYAYLLVDWQRMELAAMCAVLILIRHHANIRRLFKRQEPKIGAGGERAAS